MSCILTGFNMIDEITRGIEDFAITFNIFKKEVLPDALKFEGYDEPASQFFNKEFFAKKLVGLQMKAYLNCYEGRHWNNLKRYNRRLYEYQGGTLAPLENLYKDLNFYIYQCSEFSNINKPELLKNLELFRDNLAKYIVENLETYKAQSWGDTYSETKEA